MSILFLFLQLLMLCIQIYTMFRGIESGDMFSKQALYGCGIWGGPVVLLLGMAGKYLGGV